MPGFTDTAKTVLITGAAGVLGRAATAGLLDKGFNVVLFDNDHAGLEEMGKAGDRRAKYVHIDLRDPQDIGNKYRALEEEGITVDILINNAGILTTNKVAETSLEEWQKILDVNLTAGFCLAKLVIPAMKKKGWGRIVNITYLAAKTGGLTAGTAYSVSKGALISLTFSLAAELARFGITVNGIAPAYIKTPMVNEQLTKEQREDILAKIPVCRFCDADEVVHTIEFLIDDRAGFITGEIVDQNGGLYFD